MNAPAQLPPELTPDGLRREIAALLHEDPGDIAEDDNLADAGLDSIRTMKLVVTWRKLGADVNFDELIEKPTLAHWSALIASRINI